MAKTKKEIIEELKQADKKQPVRFGGKSQRWLQGRVKNLVDGEHVQIPKAGRMYIYEYFPISDANKLPVYDRFPLIIALEVSPKLMLGVNLHYLPRKARTKFFIKVLNSGVSANVRRNSRIKLNLNIPSILFKNYLPNRIKGKIIEIPPEEWALAVALPTAQFIDR